jgi:enediyne biosynthesis protein E3
VRRLRALLCIDPAEATFARRGFRASSETARTRLETVGDTFVRGYNAALLDPEPWPLGAALGRVDGELRGFAFEGAGMALALLDALTPWNRGRLARFLHGPGAPHTYLVHVGAGWAFARLRRALGAPPAGLDPLLGWLALDGYGFHEGYFHPAAAVRRGLVPRRLSGYARRVHDQGVGRALWFVHGADVDRVAAAVSAFAPGRRADLWSGVGLACAYAGGADSAAAARLPALAGEHRSWLGQGAAFAAKARERAGTPSPHTDLACALLAGVSASRAAQATDLALATAPANRAIPAYEGWRTHTRNHLPTEVCA